MTRKGGMTRESFKEVGWYDQWDKKTQTRQGKANMSKQKSNMTKEKAMRQAEKLKDDKKATMTEGINLALLCFCLFLKKRFNRHESGSKNDITIRL